MGAEAAHAHTERELRGLCGEPLRLTGEPAGRQARGGRAREGDRARERKGGRGRVGGKVGGEGSGRPVETARESGRGGGAIGGGGCGGGGMAGEGETEGDARD